jgi:hypothetical protein
MKTYPDPSVDRTGCVPRCERNKAPPRPSVHLGHLRCHVFDVSPESYGRLLAGRFVGMVRYRRGVRGVTGDSVSGGGDAGPGGVIGDELVERAEGGGEFRGCVGPVGCHERPEDVVVDAGVEAGE